MKMRAAVLERFGEPLVVQDVDLAPPKNGEVLVKVKACGVCHTDLYTASGVDPSGYSPDRPRPRGRGRRRGGRPRRHERRTGRSRDHAVLAGVRTVHPLQERQDQHLPLDPRTAGQGLPARRHASPLAQRRADPPLHGHEHVRGIHRHARGGVGQGRPEGPLRRDLHAGLRRDDGPRRRDLEGRGRAGQHGGRVRLAAWSASARSSAPSFAARSRSSCIDPSEVRRDAGQRRPEPHTCSPAATTPSSRSSISPTASAPTTRSRRRAWCRSWARRSKPRVWAGGFCTVLGVAGQRRDPRHRAAHADHRAQGAGR